jgi:hypothetical protein
MSCCARVLSKSAPSAGAAARYERPVLSRVGKALERVGKISTNPEVGKHANRRYDMENRAFAPWLVVYTSIKTEKFEQVLEQFFLEAFQNPRVGKHILGDLKNFQMELLENLLEFLCFDGR